MMKKGDFTKDERIEGSDNDGSSAPGEGHDHNQCFSSSSNGTHEEGGGNEEVNVAAVPGNSFDSCSNIEDKPLSKPKSSYKLLAEGKLRITYPRFLQKKQSIGRSSTVTASGGSSGIGGGEGNDTQTQEPDIYVAAATDAQTQEPDIYVAAATDAPTQEPDIYVAAATGAQTQEPDIYVAATIDAHDDPSVISSKDEARGVLVEFSSSSGNNNNEKQREEEANQATLLQQEKRYIAYPRIFYQKKPDSKDKKIAEKSAATLSLGGESHEVSNAGTSLPTLRGIMKNQSRIVSRRRTTNRKRNTNLFPVLRGLGKNHPEVDSTSEKNLILDSKTCPYPMPRGFGTNQPTSNSIVNNEESTSDRNTNPVPVLRGLGKNGSKLGSCPYNHNDDSDGNPPMLRGLGKNRGRMVSSNSGMEGTESSSDAINAESSDSLNSDAPELENADDATIVVEEEVLLDDQLDDQQQSGEFQPPPPPLPNTDPIDYDGLVEALAVEEDIDASDIMEAQPIDQEYLDQRAAEKDAKEKHWKRCACGLIAVACLVLTVSLAIGLPDRKKSNSVVHNEPSAPSSSPTGSPTRPLPPMEHLELLYAELPEKTKESLFDKASPQYQAWAWSLNHPNITTYPEWRKKQIFAMATFFYSFEGPNWPNETPNRERWMDVTTSECSWVMSDSEVLFFTEQSAAVYGPDAYQYHDIKPCNDDGKLQTLLVHHLYLPANVTPGTPPEIELLTSLRTVGIFMSQITAKLADIMIPALIQLPHLVNLNLAQLGVTGTIPQDIGLMTGLRHFSIAGNRLGATIPTTVGKMTSLEMFSLSQMDSLFGTVPSELGLMTSLTRLDISQAFITGSIPSEVALLSQLRWLHLTNTGMTSAIPSEVGSMTSLTHLELDYNRLDGSIPSEVGKLTTMPFFSARNNALSGPLPSELGLMSGISWLMLGNDMEPEGASFYNSFSGSLPEELWELSRMRTLCLPNIPSIHGNIPDDIIVKFMPKLRLLNIKGSPYIGGILPQEICSLRQESYPSNLFRGYGLEFDCSDLLCGCDCPCVSSDNFNETKLP